MVVVLVVLVLVLVLVYSSSSIVPVLVVLSLVYYGVAFSNTRIPFPEKETVTNISPHYPARYLLILYKFVFSFCSFRRDDYNIDYDIFWVVSVFGHSAIISAQRRPAHPAV